MQTELSRWADVLDVCDEILEKAVERKDGSWMLAVDTDMVLREHTSVVLSFTAILFENTFTRSLYASADVRAFSYFYIRIFQRVLQLLDCDCAAILCQLLRLLHTVSKRSRFLTQKLNQADTERLSSRISNIAQVFFSLRNNLFSELERETAFQAGRLLPAGGCCRNLPAHHLSDCIGC